MMYRENRTVHASKREYFRLNPEDLPFYDFSLVKEYIQKYYVFSIEASRGCPYRCTFCQGKEHGVRVIAENDWERAYIPRYTMLFDPSRELPASKMVDFFLGITSRYRGTLADMLSDLNQIFPRK